MNPKVLILVIYNNILLMINRLRFPSVGIHINPSDMSLIFIPKTGPRFDHPARVSWLLGVRRLVAVDRVTETYHFSMSRVTVT